MLLTLSISFLNWNLDWSHPDPDPRQVPVVQAAAVSTVGAVSYFVHFGSLVQSRASPRRLHALVLQLEEEYASVRLWTYGAGWCCRMGAPLPGLQ